MSLKTPKLDDRTFQDIVDEAKRRIPLYTAEWTDHNISDPGVTLIELFAWMTETILYRMNQVPDLHYIKMMEMLGVQLQAPRPARTEVTFWLSVAQEEAFVIPLGTEVSTTEADNRPVVVFSTDEDLTIQPPELEAIIKATYDKAKGGQLFEGQPLSYLEGGEETLEVFSAEPQVNDALYLGFENDLSHHLLELAVEFDEAGGSGVDPTLPPYVWEAYSDDQWAVCEVDLDNTLAMNRSGNINIHLPQLVRTEVQEKALFWVRVRVKAISPEEEAGGMRPYWNSPRLLKCRAMTRGGTVAASHARYVRDEQLGQSDGSAGQCFKLQHRPIATRREDERLFVQPPDEEPQPWQEVTDFSISGAGDRHYTLDSVSGEIRFGPAIRQTDGAIRLYGDIPPRGARLFFSQYRLGGELEGNVQAGSLNVLRSALPLIVQATNRHSARGGIAPETVEAAMARVPQMLRTRNRAVTAEDFEYLAYESNPALVGRVKCLPASAENGLPAGRVKVLLIPRIYYGGGADHPALPPDTAYLEPFILEMSDAAVADVRQYLERRCLLTTRLEIGEPHYCWTAVRLELQVEVGQDAAEVEAAVLRRLYRFLNPLQGGREGSGWPFGRDLFPADIYQALADVPGIGYLGQVQLFSARPGGEAEGEPLASITVPEDGVIASGLHRVFVVQGDE